MAFRRTLSRCGGRAGWAGRVALGGSVGTPAGGVSAEVIEARSIADLLLLGEKVRGKLVFLNHSMSTASGKAGYGEFVGLRVRGPAEAAKLGAVGLLLRSLAT